MSSNCFVQQEATLEILTTVTSFCANCYQELSQKELIFYDLNEFRYLCKSCCEKISKTYSMDCRSEIESNREELTLF